MTLPEFTAKCPERRLQEGDMPAAHQASLSITNSRNLLKLRSTESVMSSNHRIICHPLLIPPSIFPSIRVFSNESALHIRWPKYWSFSFNINPSNEQSGLISFRMDWLDLLAVQGTLKGLLQHYNSKASVLQWSPWNPLNPPWSSWRSYPERNDFTRVYCKVPRAPLTGR